MAAKQQTAGLMPLLLQLYPIMSSNLLFLSSYRQPHAHLNSSPRAFFPFTTRANMHTVASRDGDTHNNDQGQPGLIFAVLTSVGATRIVP